ncbi:MAG: ABC transporter permease [Vicinamibacteria bacterium]|nr:ABC transporter permease [Vicinamibacteria bacterium]
MNVMAVYQDLRLAFKSMLHQRSFTLAALTSLALGIGATTALFSVVYGVLFRSLPFPESDRLVRLSEYHPGANAGVPGSYLTNFTYFAWSNPKSIEGLAGYSNETFTDTSGDEPVRIEGASVTPSTFSLLGVLPALGRLLVEDDGKESAPKVAVLSDGFWKERFGGDPSAIGKTITLDGQIHTVVGVAPPRFYFPSRGSRVWTSYSIPVGSADPNHQSIWIFSAIARLKPGFTPEQAAEEGTLAARSVARPPVADALFGKGGPVAIKAETVLSGMTARVRPALLLLAAGVGLILLIACANVASLQLTRGVSRQREIAVRTALGASRFQLVRQLVTESLVLSLTGGMLGLMLGSTLLALLPALAPANFPRLQDISLDRVALTFAALISVAAGLLSGLLPALRSSQIGLVPALRDGSGASAGIATQRLRSGLVVIEAALAVMLLIGAGLLVRSFSQLMQVDPGYQTGNVLVASLNVAGERRPAEKTLNLSREILGRIRALPGVLAAGVGNMTPLDFITAVASFDLPDERSPEGKVKARATSYTISPGFAEALSLRVKEGRLLGPEDETSAIEHIMVNEEFARVYLSDGKPVVGRRFEGLFRSQNPPVTTEIVGIVVNVLKNGMDAQPLTEMFSLPRFGKQLPAGFQIVIRSTSEAKALAPSVRAMVRELDPVATVETAMLSTRVAASVAQPRFAAQTVAAFALLALSLAAFGLYGAMSYNVTQRKRELGVRSALGATRRDIVRLILRQGLAVATLGLGLGVLLAMALSRLIEKLLFGVTPLDPIAFASAPGLLLIAAVAACLVPAFRGASVEPTEALRCE